MKKTALIIVDLQKAYHEFPLLKSSVDLSLSTINSALELFRRTSNPIFFIQHADNYLVREGSEGFELSDAIEYKQGEYKIIKRHSNSFYQTSLAEELKKAQVELVIICGLAASKCVRSTVQGAVESGFKAAVLQHGAADIKEHLTLVPYETCPIVSVDILQYFLQQTQT